VTFIQADQARWGVEPICRVLQVTPASYYASVSRPPSARALRDETPTAAITRVWQEHQGVYGADKVWAQLRREGTRVARCTVARLMREPGLRGAVEIIASDVQFLGSRSGERDAKLPTDSGATSAEVNLDDIAS
jgi:putative transposase